MARPHRTSPGLYVLLVVYIGFSLSYYVAGLAALHQRWFHGDRHAGLPFRLNDDRISHPAKAAADQGIAEGDVLATWNDGPFTGDAAMTDYLRSALPGDRVTMAVKHADGRLAKIELRLSRYEGPAFTWAIMAYLVAIVTVPLLSLIVGYWTVAARPWDLNAWLVLIILTFSEVGFGDLLAVWWGGAWYIVFSVWMGIVVNLAFAALAWFGLLFPERSRIDVRWPWLKWVIAAVQIALVFFYLWLQYLQSFNLSALTQFKGLARVEWVEELVEAFCVVLFLIAIVDKQRSGSTADARRRLRVLTLGSCLSLGPLLLIFSVLPMFGFDPHHGPLFLIPVTFLVLFPLTLAYVLAVQRAMDIRVLLRMGTKYVLAKATLVVAEIAAALLATFYFIVPAMERNPQQAVALLLIAVVLAALFGAYVLRGNATARVQKWLDRKFFRESYDAEVVLSELSEHARTFTEKAPLIETVSRRISEVLHVPYVAVWLSGSPVFQLQQTLGLGAMGPVILFEASATIENLARTNLPARVYRDRPDEWLTHAGQEEVAVLDKVHAELLLPLPGRERLMGVIALGPKRSEEPYTATDLRVLQSVATQTGLALEVSDLAHSLAKEAAQRARSDRELEIAHEVQDRLFPQRIPAREGIQLAGFCRPAQGVGGDYYDVIELEDGRLGLAIGDVSGKGIPAALLMASLRACLRTMTLVATMDLATLMHRMNQLVFEASAMNRYATFFFAIYDPATRVLNYVNAGHNPPVVLREPGGERILLEATGPVVGLLRDVGFEAGSVELRAGDLLLAYTDGISEALTADEEEWGEERMILAAGKARAGSAEEILRAIFAAADEFTGKAAQYDDMTLLVAALS